MPAKLNNSIFIKRSNIIHDFKYDYSNVIYEGMKNKVIIICPRHGEFLQKAGIHLRGHGCSNCKIQKISERCKHTTNQFINKAILIHGDRYDYSKVKYGKNGKDKVVIICPIHNQFLQCPESHINQKAGCIKCGKIKIGNLFSSNTEEFINQAKKIHGDKYDYSLVKYGKNNSIKIIIICPDHGEFLQTPNRHLSGDGCKFCMINLSGWTNTLWKNASLTSKHFDSYKVYIIRCWNEFEEFYKIGKTFTKIEKRFIRKNSMPYNYEIIKIYSSKKDAEKISKLEKELHKKYKNFKYLPKIKFNGWTECFIKINY